ncbi:hypothetical protein F-VV10_0458 [Faustovirus]|nr:hypothetical protein F-VV10_0458 [Faustovirus]
MENCIIPCEIICEIAKADWRAWSKLRLCCVGIHAILSAIDPYIAFTKRKLMRIGKMHELYIGAYTYDNVLVRIIARTKYGSIIVWHNNLKAAYYDYQIDCTDKIKQRYYVDNYIGVKSTDIERLSNFPGHFVKSHREFINKFKYDKLQSLYSRESSEV